MSLVDHFDASLPALDADCGANDAIRHLTAAFQTVGLDDAAHEAHELVLRVLDLSRADLMREPEKQIGVDGLAALRASAGRRLAREPLSRIIGNRGFWTLDLEISPGVLDPRPETETVVEAAIEALRDSKRAPLRILDLGVGSGALLCALLSEFPEAEGVGVDLSDAACQIARRNLDRCGLSQRSVVLNGGWDAAHDRAFDLVVSNPPYIPTASIEALEPEVRLYDPRLALDGGPDGLDDYRRIASVLPRLLAPGAVVVFEVGFDQADSVMAILAQTGLVALDAKRDLAGWRRAVIGRKSSDAVGQKWISS